MLTIYGVAALTSPARCGNLVVIRARKGYMTMTPPLVLGTLESALYTDDTGRAVNFYHGIIGLPVIGTASSRNVFFRVGASVLILFNPAETEVRPPGSPYPVPRHGARGPGHYCFAVQPASQDALRSHLIANGIGIEADFRWSGGARSIYVRDPAGNSIEFADPALWN